MMNSNKNYLTNTKNCRIISKEQHQKVGKLQESLAPCSMKSKKKPFFYHQKFLSFKLTVLFRFCNQ